MVSSSMLRTESYFFRQLIGALLLIMGGTCSMVKGVEPDSVDLKTCSSIFESARFYMSPNHNNPDSVLILSDSLYRFAEAIGSPMYMGRALYCKGSAKGNGEEREAAMEDMEQAAQYMEEIQDTVYLLKAYYSLAAMHYLQESHSKAQQNAANSIKLARKAKDTLVWGLSLNLMGLIQKDLENYEVAKDYFREAPDGMNVFLKNMLLQNLGIVHKELEEYEEARQCFEQVIANAQGRSMANTRITALNNLGTVEIRLENFAKALLHLREAESLITERTSVRLKGGIYLSLGVALQKKEGCSQALPYYEKARAFFESVDEQKNLVIALEDEAECRHRLGQSKKAYELLERAKIISDSLFTLDRAEAVAALEQEFRQAKKQRMIEELEQTNAIAMERNQANDRALENRTIIVVLLALIIVLLLVLGYAIFRVQKNRLLKQNESDKQHLLRQQIKPHFIFNALNSVQHFLLHDKKKEGLLYLGKFGTLLRLILNNSEEDLVSLAEELKLVRHYLDMEKIRTNQAFEYAIQVEDGLDIEHLQIPGMVLQVLVENAVWHGAGKASDLGEVVLKVRKDKKEIQVLVEDNGPGLVKGVPKAGHDQHPHGLELVRNRIERSQWKQVKYAFHLENKLGEEGQTTGCRAMIRMMGNDLF